MKERQKSREPVCSRSLLAAAISTALSGAMAHGEQPSTDGMLQEITVTATRRAESVQDVPLSITALTGETLEKRGITDIMSLDRAVPGLILENSGSDPTPIIRGAGVAGTTDVAVPFYIDGIYQPHSGQGLVGYTDLERAEILKGPQGTLFGRNTLGGLINLIAKKPSFSGFDLGAAVTAGAYKDRKLEAFVNVPLGDSLALRVSGAAEKRDPFVKNIANSEGGLKDADYSYARAQLRWKASDTLNFNFSTSYWHDTSNGNNDFGYKVLGIPVNATTQAVDGVNGFLDQRQGLRTGWGGGKSATGNISNGDASAGILADPYRVAWDYNPHRDLKETSVALNVIWNLPGHDLVINAARYDYRELRLADGELSTAPAFVAGNLIKSKSNQIDINLNSTWAGKWKYTLGAYYYDDSRTGNNTNAFLFGYTYTSPQKPSWAYWEYQTDGGTKSKALYGQAEYSLTDKLSGIGGVRWTRDERRSYQLNADQTSLEDPLPSYVGPAVNLSNGTSDHVDFKIGINYKLYKDVLLYAYEATGYIAGGTQELTNKLLAPQRVRTYEAGAKTTVLDGHLRFNIAAYTSAYTGLTTTVFVPVGNTILSQQIPGGSIKSRGVEIDATFLPIPDLQVDLGLAADRSTFDKFVAADRLGTAGASYVDANGKGWFILNGQPTSFSPDLTLNLGLNYDMHLPNGMGILSPAAYLKYSDSYKTTSEPYFWSVQPSYVIADLAMTWRAPDGKLSVKGFVNNVGNKAVMTEGTVYSGSRAVADFSNPRFWGIRVGYNF